MSESKVPLPEPLIKGWELAECSYALWDEDQMRSYGDDRADEARRLALLEAAELCDKITTEALRTQKGEPNELCNVMARMMGVWSTECANRLRALADNASPKQVSG